MEISCSILGKHYTKKQLVTLTEHQTNSIVPKKIQVLLLRSYQGEVCEEELGDRYEEVHK